MDVNIYVKFKELFRKIFEENYVISRYYSERLLKRLEDQNREDVTLLDTPVFSDLIFHALDQDLCVPNRVFILELITLLCRNELQFNKLESQGLVALVENRVVNNLRKSRPSAGGLYIACVKLITAIISHCSGMNTVKTHKPWDKALYPGLHLKPAHVTRTVYEFFSKLVWRLDECEDEATLYEVLRGVIKPIQTSEYQTLEVFDTEKDKLYSEAVIAPLHVLLAIMSETERLIHSKYIVSVMKVCYFIEAPIQALSRVMRATRDPDIVVLCADLNFRFLFAVTSKAAMKAGRSESDFLNEVIACYVNSATSLMIKKRMITPLLDFIVNTNIFWANSGSKFYSSTFERDGQKYEMEDQFIWHLMIPILTFVTSRVERNEIVEEYDAKMGQLLTEHITKCGYLFKTILLSNDLKKYTIQSIKQVFKLKGILKAKQAGILFQNLFYLLQIFVLRPEVASSYGVQLIVVENLMQTSDDVKMLSLTLAAIKMLLTEHNINWYESVEIICLQTALLELSRSDLPTKQLLQVLDLLELSVKQFLAPDMTLLVESKQGSTLNELTNVMPHYMTHEEWEVRDSAFSLLRACTDIAFVKYEPLQKMILDNKLMILATQAAFNDSEYYVQTTALKCLAEATKIDSIWREVIKNNDIFPRQLMHILKHNPEGMVRTEAANVLTQIYTNHNTNKSCQNYMYKVMTSLALDDLHWEVQIAALKFWNQVIINHLSDRGMIDGKFPKVTFSKEKRKIIVLDEKEVKRQLTCIMNDLSEIGCLNVLSECINEHFNIQVMELTYSITKKLVDILDYHQFGTVPQDASMEQINQDAHMETAIDEVLDLSLVTDNSSKRDETIEYIVNTKTSDLIMNLHKNNVAKNGIDQTISIQFKSRQNIHPNQFLENFRGTDYASIISNIKNWRLDPPDLDVLLDEVLEDASPETPGNCME